MIKNRITNNTQIKQNTAYIGETIEEKVDRIFEQKEPITDGAPIIYTDRKEGVMAGYDPRTDRWDVALDAMSLVQKDKIAKRDAYLESRLKKAVKEEELPSN